MTGARNASASAYPPQPQPPTQQQQPNAYQQQQEHSNPLQKLASFGGGSAGSAADFNRMDPNAAGQGMYQGYGPPPTATDRPMGPPPGAGYPHQQRQMVRPPPGPTSANQYPYQTADSMYSMPDVQVNINLIES